MKTKAQKQEILDQLSEEASKQKAMVFVDFKGIRVKDLLALRKQLKQVNAKLQVAKKTLLQRVLNKKKIGIDVQKLSGEVAAIFAYEDPIPAVKTAYQFAKTNEHLKVLAGFLDSEVYEPDVLKEIAGLPSKEVLLGRLVWSVASPLSGFLNVLQGNTKGLIRVLAQVKTA